MRTTRILTFTLLFVTLQSSAQGLMFNGMESSIDERTSYDVFSSRKPKFTDVLKIEFSLSMYLPSDFGYILRIKNNEDERIFNLLYSGVKWDRECPFRLNEEGKSTIIKTDIPHDYIEMGKWMDVVLEFTMAEGKVTLKIDDYIYETSIDPISSIWRPVINFGKSDYMIDVPSMAVRDLTISDGRKKFVFPLNESEGEEVNEIKGKTYGVVNNPQWLMHKSYKWDEVASFSSQSRAGVNYDRFRKNLVYYNRDSIYIYDFISKETRARRFESCSPVNPYLGTSFVNPADSLLYVYEPYVENGEPAMSTLAAYDPDDNSWVVKSCSTLPIRFHHHSSYLDEKRKRFVIFGGFGSMIYNGDFYSCDLNDYQWQKDTLPSGDRIYPRYFTSLGYSPSEDALYIFGGMGNESGEQIVGRNYFYDLYRLDLSTGVNATIWGKDLVLDWMEENMVPVRNMVLHDGGFYTMCYPEFHTNSYLQLFYFDIESATYSKLCNKIPIRSDKMSTNANLYFDQDLRLLILTVMESPDDVQSHLRVYALSFPPLTDAEYLAASRKSHVWVSVLVSLLVVLAVVSIIYSKARHGSGKDRGTLAILGRKRYLVDQKPNSICLFGGFSALDVNGNDVPFPYQQRKMLCLIIKYSLDDGISSGRLSKIMWPDKSEDKVKNSRGVAINHLRRLLDNFDGVSLVCENGHFKLQYSDSFSCDWMEFRKESLKEHPDMEKVMPIVSRGKFLPFIEDPVFDSFKENTESLLINMLSAELIRCYENKQYVNVLDLAEVIFHTDSLNEQALICQLNSLVRLKRAEDALVRYSAFVKEYNAMYDAEYEHDFKSLIE